MTASRSPALSSSPFVALYGGSFNPPHLGHVLATAYVLSAWNAEAVWWIPVGRHAFDKDRHLVDFGHRLAMCELAVAPFGTRAAVLDVEGRRSGTSRTIDTVRELQAQHPRRSFRLLIGTDLWPDTPRWKAWDELCALAPPLLVGRQGYPLPSGEAPAVSIPAISSTAIRAALTSPSPEDAQAALPHAVWAYVWAHGLYRSAEELEG